MNQAPKTDHKPSVLVFTSVEGKGRRQQEDQLQALGFEEVECRDFPSTMPSVAKFGCVVCVIDQVKRDAWVLPQTAATRAGLPFFAVTRRSSDTSWRALRDWARAAFGEAKAPESIFEDSVFRETAKEAVGEFDKMRKELAGWQKLATDYDEEKQVAERERDAAVAQAKDAAAELSRTKEIAEGARRNAIVFKRDLEDAQKQLRERKAHGDELASRLVKSDATIQRLNEQVDNLAERLVKSDSRVRELEITAKDLRQKLTDVKVAPPEASEAVEELRRQLNSSQTMLRKARGERDEAKAALQAGSDAKGISAVAKQLWALVESEVLDAEEAFDKLVKYVGGES